MYVPDSTAYMYHNRLVDIADLKKAHTHDAVSLFYSVMHKDVRNMTVSDP